jgi:hypothetical protein
MDELYCIDALGTGNIYCGVDSMATLTKIGSFLSQHHVLTLATMGDTLWCCSMFYAFDPLRTIFIVASDKSTQHIQNTLINPTVAGTVHLETKTVGKIQGIQFSGTTKKCDDEELKKLYFDTFIYAKIMNPTLWEITLDEIKMTDNTLGFGKKLIWKRV